jgi:large subunit ribosomal protein L25
MSDAFRLQVETRDPAKNKGTGSRVSRRLRAQGRIPAIVYGHKQAPQPISIARDDVWAMLKNASHLAELATGDSSESVLVRDLQWDHLGKEILHVDFVRVSADEAIETTVKLDFHGNPPGLNEGGTLDVLAHELTVRCPAGAIPDAIRVEIGELHLNQGIHVHELTLPPGVVPTAEGDLLLVHVVARPVAEEAASTLGTSNEPEVIRREKEDKDKE